MSTIDLDKLKRDIETCFEKAKFFTSELEVNRKKDQTSYNYWIKLRGVAQEGKALRNRMEMLLKKADKVSFDFDRNEYVELIDKLSDKSYEYATEKVYKDRNVQTFVSKDIPPVAKVEKSHPSPTVDYYSYYFSEISSNTQTISLKLGTEIINIGGIVALKEYVRPSEFYWHITRRENLESIWKNGLCSSNVINKNNINSYKPKDWSYATQMWQNNSNALERDERYLQYSRENVRFARLNEKTYKFWFEHDINESNLNTYVAFLKRNDISNYRFKRMQTQARDEYFVSGRLNINEAYVDLCYLVPEIDKISSAQAKSAYDFALKNGKRIVFLDFKQIKEIINGNNLDKKMSYLVIGG